MTNALTIYNQFDQLEKAATALQKSGYFKDVTTQGQALVKVMAGAELGLPPFASMTGIHIIQGKPVLGANVLATLVKNDPRYNYRIVTKLPDQDKEMYLEWYEDGKPVGLSGFTIKEAQAAGLTGKDNWKHYPSDMLFARAISRGARRFAPGVFGGSPVYTPDELGADVDPDGYVDAVAVEVTEQTEQTEQKQPAIVYPPELAVVTDSRGNHYVDLPTEKLAHMANSIADELKKPHTEDEKATYSMKADTIKQIMALRNQQ